MSIVLDGTTGINTSAGVEHAGAYTGSYSDGLVADYVTGLGRISVGGGDALAFYNGGVATTELMRITAGGNVGINTNNPQYILDVQAASGASIGRFKATTGTNESYITVANNGVMYVGLDNSAGTAITNSAYGAFVYSSTNAPMYFFTNGVKQLNIDTSGNINFNNSNSGIKFNNTSALTNSTLNDYETGTWTPTISRTGANPAISYTTQIAYYTKIGNLVTVGFSIQVGSVSSQGSGVWQILNLPFTAASSYSYTAVGAIGYNNCWGTSDIRLAAMAGTTYCEFNKGATSGEDSTMTLGSGWMSATITYRATF